MFHFNIRQVCLAVTSMLVGAAGLSATCITSASNQGCVHYEWNTSANTDQYTNTPSTAQEQWFQDHMYRILGYSGYWNYRLSWFSNSWFYRDSSSLYRWATDATQHPEWVLKNVKGQNLYINWNCGNGQCDQFIPDYSNENFRQWWIQQARDGLSQGFTGIFIDDVNLVMNLSNGTTSDTPIDPNNGLPMTTANWEHYFADFLKEVRQALPNVEICHNALWFAGNGAPLSDAAVAEEIQAANYINLERGFADTGLTNSGTWSMDSLFSYIDAVHQLGSKILAEQYGFDGQFSLASYFLVNKGGDLFANDSVTPYNWPSMYDVQLGTPIRGRWNWNGLIRRDFSQGIVMINPPNAKSITMSFPPGFTDLNGNSVTTVTLAGRQGIILMGTVQTGNPLAPSVQGGPVANGMYTLVNSYSKLLADNASQSTTPGPVVQAATNNGPDQNWSFTWNGSGYYTIQNVLSKLYLTGASTQNGAVTQETASNGDNQLWALQGSGSAYVVVNKATGLAMDDPAFSVTAGTGLILWAPNGGVNQAWLIQ